MPLSVNCISLLKSFANFPNRRLHNLDVEVAASGFTRDMSDSFDEVRVKIRNMHVQTCVGLVSR